MGKVHDGRAWSGWHRDWMCEGTRLDKVIGHGARQLGMKYEAVGLDVGRGKAE